MDTQASCGRRLLAPIRSRWPWVGWGLIVQALGMGGVAIVMWRSIRNQGIGGHVTAEMIKLAWHGQLHTQSRLIVLIAGSVVYAAGSVLLARPYVSSPAALFIAVPIAAVAGLLSLGVLALGLVALFLLSDGGIDLFDLPDRQDDGRRRRR
jgi:hypothetical protein